MQYEHIKQEACEANRQLPGLGLVLFTFGNASAADRSLGVFAIKPSGVPYEDLLPEDMIVVDFDGKTVEGKLRPSSDTPTHAALYKYWENTGGIVHTHSMYATAWAQACRDIPVYGTTHADYSRTGIPCTAPMQAEKIKGDYEYETGLHLVNSFKERGIDHREVEMALVGTHAPFTWGKDTRSALHNSAVLEFLAELAWLTEKINPDAKQLDEELIRKHFERKHGPGRYYGQS